MLAGLVRKDTEERRIQNGPQEKETQNFLILIRDLLFSGHQRIKCGMFITPEQSVSDTWPSDRMEHYWIEREEMCHES